MKKILFILMLLVLTIEGKNVSEKDLEIRISDASTVVGMSAKMVKFGGQKEPLCKLAISNDGQYFFLKKVNSNCLKMTNSKGVKIICNSNKSICKTRKELLEFIQTVQPKNNIQSDKVAKYESACNKGDVESCVKLGFMYYTGKKIKKDQDKALKIFKPICAEKIETCALLSKIILSEDIESGIGDGLYILERACTSGDAKSCTKLGILYDDGDKVTKDDTKSNDYFRKACEFGEGNACAIIGVAYLKGEGVQKDNHKAVTMFKKACDLNASLACKKLGTIYSSEEYGVKNIQEAIYFWGKACELKNKQGCSVLGAAYYLGEITEKNIEKAIKYWSKSCKLKDGKLCNVVGDIYAKGKGVDKDEKKAVAFWEKACEYNHTENCALLGKYYFEGSAIVKIDKKKAAFYFKKGCEGDDYSACDVAGAIYANGAGVDKDNNLAAKLLTKACDGGNVSGCQNLGVMYENGYGGLSKDLDKALELYEKGCEGGDINGCKKYKNIVDAKRYTKKAQRRRYITSLGYDAPRYEYDKYTVWYRPYMSISDGSHIYAKVTQRYRGDCYQLLVGSSDSNIYGGCSNCSNSLNSYWSCHANGSGSFNVNGNQAEAANAIVQRSR